MRGYRRWWAALSIFVVAGVVAVLVLKSNVSSPEGFRISAPARDAHPLTIDDLRAVAMGTAPKNSPLAAVHPAQPGLDVRLAEAEGEGKGEGEGSRESGLEAGRDLREQWFRFMRTYPADHVPAKAYQTAYEQLQNQTQIEPLTAADTWQGVGPAPIVGENNGAFLANASGRTTAILIHPTNPNIVYIGAAQGGVWKTVNGGTSWTPLTDQQASLAIGAMAFDPTNPNIIYVGTGEPHSSLDSYYGAGILKTSDGGATWTRLGASIFGGMGISDIVVDPTNPSIVYAAASTSVAGDARTAAQHPGVYKSTNGGTSWVAATTCDPSSCRGASALVMDPADHNILYVGFDALGLFKSTNGGGSWTEKDSGWFTPFRRIELAIGRFDGRLYAGVETEDTNGTTGYVYRSDNGADNWTWLNGLQVNGQTTSYCGDQCWYDNVVSVNPTNSNIVMVGGAALYNLGVDGIGGTIFRSVDGGTNWSYNAGTSSNTTIHPDLHAIAFAPSNASTIWIGNDGGVYRSTDGGATWQNMNGNLATLQFESVALHPTNPNIILGGMQDNAKTKTINGGTSWVGVDAGDGGVTAIDPFNPIYWYGTRFNQPGNMQFQRNDSGGSTPFLDWQVLNSGINPNDPVLFYAPFTLDPNTAGRIYWGTNHVYRTDNRGNSWSSISPDLTKGLSSFSAISNIAVAPGNPNTILVGTSDGNVQVTSNGGTSWNNVTAAPLPNRSVSDVAIGPQNAQTMYVVYNGFNINTPGAPGHVFKSTNGGTSWTNASTGLPDIPVLTVALDASAPNTVYVGTDIGVYRSTNGGANWAPFNQGLPVVAVYDLALNPNTHILAAATHGRGIWRITLATSGQQSTYLPALIKTNAPPPPTPTPTQVPATPTPTQGSGLPTVKNGNFELGDNGDWTESTRLDFPLIVSTADLPTTFPPHSGQWAAWLGGGDDEVSDLSQTFAIPSSGPVYLHYYYWIGSDETNCGADTFRLLVNSTPVAVNNLCISTRTGGWVHAAVNLGGFAGQTVTVHFHVETNPSPNTNSNFFLDDVSFKSTATAPQEPLGQGNPNAAQPRRR